jgi:diguanylate cyclase (GGDEF)-like protein
VRGTRLSRWLLLRQGLVLLVASALVLAITSAVVGRGFSWIERDRLQELLNRSAAALRSSAQAMLTSNKDYAGWDDTYRFVTQGDPAYLDTNFTSDSATNLGVDWIAFVGADGTVGPALHMRTGGMAKPLAASHEEALQQLIATAGIHARDAGGTSLLWVSGAPVLVAYSPVTDSAHTKNAGSWLVFGRSLRTAGEGRPEWSMGMPFEIQPAGPDQPANPPIEVDGSSLTGQLGLSPWPASLVLREPPAYSMQRDAVLKWLLVSMAGLVILAIVGMAALMRHKVLLRLERFAALAEQSSTSQGAATRWPVFDDDELDSLARALNAMMERIEEQGALLAHLASHDPLTELGNRRQLMEGLRLAIELRTRQEQSSTCLVLVDLDQFKTINDSMGHSAGDRVLETVAERIMEAIRPGDVAVRLGGDEFAIMLADTTPELAHRFCDRLLIRLAHSMPYEDRLLFTTVSIGIAWVDADLTAHDLLRRADRAMYRAKQLGRNRVVTYEATIEG